MTRLDTTIRQHPPNPSARWVVRSLLLAIAILIVALLWAGAGWRINSPQLSVVALEPQRRGLPSSEAFPPVAEVPQPGPESDFHAAHEALHVWLRDVRQTRHVRDVARPPFAAVWPSEDDARWEQQAWDHVQTPAQLLRLSERPGPWTSGLADRVLALASEEGFDGAADLQTPEDALVALHVAWVAMEVGYKDSQAAFFESVLPEGLSRADLPAEQLQALNRSEGMPRQDPSGLRGTALYAQTLWPDHPVSDHALLALVRSELAYGHGPWDPTAVLPLLASMSDPAILEQGLLVATRIREASPDLVDLAATATTTSPQSALSIATWAMAQSVKAEDWQRASDWSDRTAAAVEEVCAEDRGSAAVPCEFGRYQLRETTSRLIALEFRSPSTWQDALSAEAWRCFLDGASHAGTSRTHLRWTGERWAPEPWDRPTEVTACLSAVQVTEVVPKSPVRVRLTVEADL